MQKKRMKKIRCKECGAIIAYENEPITSGEISILCTARKPNGQRCKTVNLIKGEKEGKTIHFDGEQLCRAVFLK